MHQLSQNLKTRAVQQLVVRLNKDEGDWQDGGDCTVAKPGDLWSLAESQIDRKYEIK
jgi:hypothetical protein